MRIHNLFGGYHERARLLVSLDRAETQINNKYRRCMYFSASVMQSILHISSFIFFLCCYLLVYIVFHSGIHLYFFTRDFATSLFFNSFNLASSHCRLRTAAAAALKWKNTQQNVITYSMMN